MRKPLRVTHLALAAAFLLAAAGAATADGPLSLAEVESLLEAGVGETVILLQVEATGTRLMLTADDLLRLKAAGATDRLLAALMGPAGPTPKTSFRVYREKNDHGEEILVVTNLDEAGRRIGGEIPQEAHEAATPVSAREPAETVPAQSAAPAPGHEGGDDAGPSPVTVNIYPPYPDDTAPYAVGGLYWLGGYRSDRCFTPFPGHHPDGDSRRPRVESGLFGQPRAINTQPYRAGTAAQRNRARSRRP